MFKLPQDRIAIMGILNMTPDSFSDGGRWTSLEEAVKGAVQMAEEGADLIDVGGESTRPGSDSVEVSEELRRVIPVIQELNRLGLKVSVDTRKAVVAEQAIEVGAVVVNDVSGLSDPAMAALVAKAKVPVCIMHCQGDPKTMQVSPKYDDVVAEVKKFLVSRALYAQDQGVDPSQIWIDPGFGFGKTLEHNLKLIYNLRELVSTGYPVLIGVSRKSSIGSLLKDKAGIPASTENRIFGSTALQAIAQWNGARIIRTHDVKETVETAKVIGALMSQGKG